jgi:hypothetical protein
VRPTRTEAPSVESLLTWLSLSRRKNSATINYPRWNKVDGRVVSRHGAKEGAVEAGREIAIKLEAEHTIHREDGVITEKNSYRNDPCPPMDS